MIALLVKVWPPVIRYMTGVRTLVWPECSVNSGIKHANTSVAVMATSQDFGSTYNRVFSFDTRLQLLRNWILSGQAITAKPGWRTALGLRDQLTY